MNSATLRVVFTAGGLYTLADMAGGTAASPGEWIAALDSDFHYLRSGLDLPALAAVDTEL